MPTPLPVETFNYPCGMTIKEMTMLPTQETIRNAYGVMRRSQGMRARDIAHALQITEGQLIAAHLQSADETAQGEVSTQASVMSAVRLDELWLPLLQSLESLGSVMALTRNHACVHETIGIYKNISSRHGIGIVQGDLIELRAFYRSWQVGFAVTEPNWSKQNGDVTCQHSLQFFDEAGVAIHKVYLLAKSNLPRYHQIVREFRHSVQGFEDFSQPIDRVAPVCCATEHVDVSAFHQAWRALEDTHEFFGLLTRFSISRIAALRLAQAEFVQSLHLNQIEALLHRVSEQKIPVMVFVANRGMLQIFSGCVKRVVVQDKWINILDERFNLHLLQDSVRTLWLVKKPTQYGYVTSIEAFDQQGELVITFFGERELDSPELQSWRDLTESLAVEAESCVH
jgi:putative hemin transport protein